MYDKEWNDELSLVECVNELIGMYNNFVMIIIWGNSEVDCSGFGYGCGKE